ncbi:MAG: zinc-dependent metalloprotease [Propionibacteriaceae bacterium]|jgi:putative hydrolase|nr:zinc-dependent metalloprotease [Propionibacteriaceae bacterium]
MSDNLDGRPAGEGDDENSLAEFLRRLGFSGGEMPEPGDLAANLNSLLGQFNSRANQGVNWQRTKDETRKRVAALGKDPSPDSADARKVGDAMRLAMLWLEPQVTLPDATLTSAAWSRADWVERTMGGWQTIAEPIAGKLADAMTSMIASETQEGDGEYVPEGLAQLRSTLLPLIRASAMQMYSAQLSVGIAEVAAGVLSASDAVLPLGVSGTAALLPANIAAFGDGLDDILPGDLLIYLALRETARAWLFESVSWLPSQLVAMVTHWASLIVIDPDVLANTIDPREMATMTPESLSAASEKLFGRMFSPAHTPEQAEILDRLETLLALVEGWVDAVVGAAASPMPNASALNELLRRRSAAGGPGEKALLKLLGLNLHAAKARNASRLWTLIAERSSLIERDSLWRHPDALPTATDLADPDNYGASVPQSSTPDDLDEQLRKLLEGGAS